MIYRLSSGSITLDTLGYGGGEGHGGGGQWVPGVVLAPIDLVLAPIPVPFLLAAFPCGFPACLLRKVSGSFPSCFLTGTSGSFSFCLLLSLAILFSSCDPFTPVVSLFLEPSKALGTTIFGCWSCVPVAIARLTRFKMAWARACLFVICLLLQQQ